MYEMCSRVEITIANSLDVSRSYKPRREAAIRSIFLSLSYRSNTKVYLRNYSRVLGLSNHVRDKDGYRRLSRPVDRNQEKPNNQSRISNVIL